MDREQEEGIIKTDESLKDLELEDVLDFYRINDEYTKRAISSHGRAHDSKIVMPQMPPSHIQLLKSFAADNDEMHYDKNFMKNEDNLNFKVIHDRKDKDITEQLVVHADIMDNYNQIKMGLFNENQILDFVSDVENNAQ